MPKRNLSIVLIAEGTPQADVPIAVSIADGRARSSTEGTLLPDIARVTTDAQGRATIALFPSWELSPAAQYEIQIYPHWALTFTMPDRDVNLKDIIDDPDPALPLSDDNVAILRDEIAAEGQ